MKRKIANTRQKRGKRGVVLRFRLVHNLEIRLLILRKQKNLKKGFMLQELKSKAVLFPVFLR
jgi:hypothetical protein